MNPMGEIHVLVVLVVILLLLDFPIIIVVYSYCSSPVRDNAVVIVHQNPKGMNK